MTGFKLALSFLTAIPVRTGAPQPGDLGRAGRWFPIVGFFLGAILATAYLALLRLFSPLLAAALVVALWAVLTGGLHLDGLADCCDSLLATVSRERRLEIMDDPRLGAFGGIGLVLFLSLKVLAIASLPDSPQFTLHVLRFTFDASLFALLVAPPLARWLILLVASQPMARLGGMGAEFALGLTPSIFILAALIPLALTVLGGWRALFAAAITHIVTFAVIGLARIRLGGVTGDVFGLTVELAELTILLTFAARVPILA